jgi:hypothetical protein
LVIVATLQQPLPLMCLLLHAVALLMVLPCLLLTWPLLRLLLG